MNKKFALAGLSIALLTLAASAQAQLSAEDMIKVRQSGYTFMAWNMGKISAQVVDRTVPYDKNQVIAAANLIAATANSGMGALFSPATVEGSGWKPTRLKANFFEEQDKVREIAMNYIEQANKLQQVAATGDEAAIRTQFGELGKACKACHDNYRAEE
jgi:cytochrome c556